MHTARLTELRDAVLFPLSTLPNAETGFSLNHWASFVPARFINGRLDAGSHYLKPFNPRELRTCGTVCCAAGYAALHPPFMAQGLRLATTRSRPSNMNPDDVAPVDAVLVYNPNNLTSNEDDLFDHAELKAPGTIPVAIGACMAFFDLTEQQAWFVFMPSSYTVVNTPEEGPTRPGSHATPVDVIEHIDILLAPPNETNMDALEHFAKNRYNERVRATA